MREMRSILLFALLFLGSSVQATGAKVSQMETMNLATVETLKKLQSNMVAKAKAIEESGKKKLGGVIGVFGKILSSVLPKSSKEADPQADLDELAGYFQALNYADIMALKFLKTSCVDNGLISPETDPVLCKNYIPILVKSIEGRIGTVTSYYMYSDEILKAPFEWPEHALEILKMLEDLSADSNVTFSIERSLIKSVKDKADGQIVNEYLNTPVASPVAVMGQDFSAMSPVINTGMQQMPIIQGQIMQQPMIQQMPIIQGQMIQQPMIQQAPMIQQMPMAQGQVMQQAPMVQQPMNQQNQIVQGQVAQQPQQIQGPIMQQPLVQQAPIVQGQVLQQPQQMQQGQTLQQSQMQQGQVMQQPMIQQGHTSQQPQMQQGQVSQQQQMTQGQTLQQPQMQQPQGQVIGVQSPSQSNCDKSVQMVPIMMIPASAIPCIKNRIDEYNENSSTNNSNSNNNNRNNNGNGDNNITGNNYNMNNGNNNANSDGNSSNNGNSNNSSNINNNGSYSENSNNNINNNSQNLTNANINNEPAPSPVPGSLAPKQVTSKSRLSWLFKS